MPQKTVLITGCSLGGIGDALAQAFHARNYRVFATARNLSKIQHLKDLGYNVIQLDVTDEESIRKAVEEVSRITGGKLDVLVNNSGGGYNQPLLDSTIPEAKKLFNLNVFGVLSICQSFIPLLIPTSGQIINIGSVVSICPVPWQGWYNASKASLTMLTNQLRLELQPWRISCTLVIAGGLKTHFFDNLEVKGVREGSRYWVAREVMEPIMRGSIVDEEGMDPVVFARKVVDNAERGGWWRKKNLWLGGSTRKVWFVNAFGWMGIWDFLMTKRFNITEVMRLIWAAEKSK